MTSGTEERGWRATFYTTGMEHSPTSATGTGWERTPWHATRRAARPLLIHNPDRMRLIGPVDTQVVAHSAPLVWSHSALHRESVNGKVRLRVMLHTRWSAEAWSQVRVEFRRAWRCGARSGARAG
jgi:hypothetical protein